ACSARGSRVAREQLVYALEHYAQRPRIWEVRDAEVIAVRNVEADAGRDQHVLLLEQVERELLVVEVRQCARIDPDERVHRPAGRGEREKAALRDRARDRPARLVQPPARGDELDRKSTRLNSSHDQISYAVFCLKKKNK